MAPAAGTAAALASDSWSAASLVSDPAATVEEQQLTLLVLRQRHVPCKAVGLAVKAEQRFFACQPLPEALRSGRHAPTVKRQRGVAQRGEPDVRILAARARETPAPAGRKFILAILVPGEVEDLREGPGRSVAWRRSGESISHAAADGADVNRGRQRQARVTAGVSPSRNEEVHSAQPDAHPPNVRASSSHRDVRARPEPQLVQAGAQVYAVADEDAAFPVPANDLPYTARHRFL
eukprot:CAMPEP_0179291774 /NCGR_PEP_ID=MMETSP0797-20121207/42510_1 /TAXON_ID=47934 /ORGANISM="Dinophysis acuminata, Strain DAEP01" /LENGTH=234 /DNA_ID=CAMNT_0021000859 /DNA_START=314 /DNA_END=1014 /DNA_ORIENTATION=+